MKKLCLLGFVFILVLSNIAILGISVNSAIASNTSSQSFSKNILISTSQVYPQHVEPTLVISPSNQIFVGWKDAYIASGPGAKVSFSSSTDGQNWTNPIIMPSNQNNIGQSQIPG